MLTYKTITNITAKCDECGYSIEFTDKIPHANVEEILEKDYEWKLGERYLCSECKEINNDSND